MSFYANFTNLTFEQKLPEAIRLVKLCADPKSSPDFCATMKNELASINHSDLPSFLNFLKDLRAVIVASHRLMIFHHSPQNDVEQALVGSAIDPNNLPTVIETRDALQKMIFALPSWAMMTLAMDNIDPPRRSSWGKMNNADMIRFLPNKALVWAIEQKRDKIIQDLLTTARHETSILRAFANWSELVLFQLSWKSLLENPSSSALAQKTIHDLFKIGVLIQKRATQPDLAKKINNLMPALLFEALNGLPPNIVTDLAHAFPSLPWEKMCQIQIDIIKNHLISLASEIPAEKILAFKSSKDFAILPAHFLDNGHNTILKAIAPIEQALDDRALKKKMEKSIQKIKKSAPSIPALRKKM